MKQWRKWCVIMAAMAAAVSGCSSQKTVVPLAEAGNMTEEQLAQELSGFDREEIASVWGEPAQNLFGMDGEIFLLGEERTLTVYYGGDGSTVESVKFGELSKQFEGTIKEINGQSAVIAVDEGFPIRNSGDMVSVMLDENTASAQAGDRVRVTYSGAVMETYPLQLGNQIEIELLAGEETNENGLAGVSMTVLDVSPTDIRIEFLNGTSLNLQFGEDYGLYKLEAGEWVSVPYLIDNWAFNAIAYLMPENTPVEWETDWETFHGALENGQYRLTKSVMDFRGTGDYTTYELAVEFEIGNENESKNEAGGVVTSPPVLQLQDALSSACNNFEVTSETYTWNYKTGNGDEMAGIAACGSGPLEAAKEKEKLKLPRYNKMDSVSYVVAWAEMPDHMTVKEYMSDSPEGTDGKVLYSLSQDEIFIISLQPGRIYEIVAEWKEEEVDEQGFYGSADYVVVTE